MSNLQPEQIAIQIVQHNGGIFSNAQHKDAAFYVNSDARILIGPYNQGSNSALTVERSNVQVASGLDVGGSLSAARIESKEPYAGLDIASGPLHTAPDAPTQLEGDFHASGSHIALGNGSQVQVDDNQTRFGGDRVEFTCPVTRLAPGTLIEFSPNP